MEMAVVVGLSWKHDVQSININDFLIGFGN